MYFETQVKHEKVMMHYKLIFLYLLLMTVVFSADEGNKDLCLEALEGTYDPVFSKALLGLGKTHSKLFRFLTGRLSQRFLDSEEPGYTKFINILEKLSDKPGVWNFALSNDQFIFEGSIELKVEKQIQILEININLFQSKKNIDGGIGRDVVKIKDRPGSLNVAFVNFVGALFSGINKAIINNPQITKVAIRGNNIVNKDLAKLVKSYGFKKTIKKTNLLMFSMKSLPVAHFIKAYMNGNSPGTLEYIGGGKIKIKLGLIHSLIRKVDGKNWILAIEIGEKKIKT